MPDIPTSLEAALSSRPLLLVTPWLKLMRPPEVLRCDAGLRGVCAAVWSGLWLHCETSHLRCVIVICLVAALAICLIDCFSDAHLTVLASSVALMCFVVALALCLTRRLPITLLPPFRPGY